MRSLMKNKLNNMRVEVKTLADKVIYTRVLSIREAVNGSLTSQLIEKGVDPETIVIETKDVPMVGMCCKQLEVKAYGEAPDKKTKAKVSLDD